MTHPNTSKGLLVARLSATVFAASLACAGAWAQTAAPAAPTTPAAAPAARAPSALTPQTAEYAGPTEIAPELLLTAGKTAVIRLPADALRISIGNPEIADVMLINPREVYVLGKKGGATNIFIWSRGGRTTIMDVTVGVDTAALKAKLTEFMPSETGISVNSMADSIVLGGRAADAVKVQRLVALAELYSGKRIVNLMRVEGAQQVMLEVKVAEVSKTLLDKLGVKFDLTRSIGNTSISLLTDFLSKGAGGITASRASGSTTISLDAEVEKGLVKILAEPTIMAVSGQEGAFLAGGKIYIPVPQSGAFGGSTITLEEKEFGVGLRFTPTVLEDGLINLRVTPEVSELSQLGTTLTTVGGQTSLLPSITTRRASTTVQLRDGETFAIGGLVRNNVTEVIKAFPVLGELPIIGALFRSTEFQTDRSELLFIVTPRLVRPMGPNYALPTDSFVEPTRREILLDGRMEGSGPPKAPGQPEPKPGFQLK